LTQRRGSTRAEYRKQGISASALHNSWGYCAGRELFEVLCSPITIHGVIRGVNYGVLHAGVKRAFDFNDALAGDLRITFCGADACMPEQ